MALTIAARGKPTDLPHCLQDRAVHNKDNIKHSRASGKDPNRLEAMLEEGGDDLVFVIRL